MREGVTIKNLRTVVLAATAAVTTAGALLLAGPAAEAAVLNYSTTTTAISGGTSVNVRVATSLTAPIAYTRPVGFRLSIDCQLPGARIGFGKYPDNRTWDRLSDGKFIHDVVTTTPGGPRVNLPDGGYVAYSPGIPTCAPTGQAAPPAPVVQNGGYPDWNAADCSARYGQWSWCESNGQYSSRNFNYRNCTDFVAWKLGLVQSQVSVGGSAYAWQWKQGWINRQRPWGNAPRVNAIAWWGQEVAHGYGHVGVVIAVNPDGSAQVAAYNANGDGTYTVNPSARADAYLYTS